MLWDCCLVTKSYPTLCDPMDGSMPKLPCPSLSPAAAAKSLQSCPTLCDPIDGSPPGFPVPGILQARTLEWVAISFSNAWKWKVIVKSINHVQLFATPWTVAYQAPLSMGFSREEYWSGLPLPSPNSTSDKSYILCQRWYTHTHTKWEQKKNVCVYVCVKSWRGGE